MLSKINGAVAAYTQAAKSLEQAGGAPGKSGGEFAAMVSGALENAIGTVAKGEAVSLQAVANQADLNEVVTAVTDAEVALQAVIAVRDRVIQAYNDIIRMPI
ncbi:MAG: flagellar hook-basal body complex protein FliE [Alphaproteobacteria bacterium]